ncbi:MAG: GPW/gp25 family protein [Acidobacteria bacterium]|nr:GPW/gp25 family protein [Acidobacteriota bacterium]
MATVGDVQQIVEQSIISIIETRQGERVMLPDYGLPDFVFSVADIGFAGRIAYHLELQVKKYEPLVEKVKVVVGSLAQESFEAGISLDQHRVALRVEYKMKGMNSSRNLVFPIWRLRNLKDGNSDV